MKSVFRSGIAWQIPLAVIVLCGCQSSEEPSRQTDSQQASAPAETTAAVSEPAGDADTASTPPAESSAEPAGNQLPEESPVTVDVNARRPAMKLSDYHLFEDLSGQVPSPGVIPYAMNSHSYLDHASQRTWLYLPPGAAAEYRPDDALSFPVGTVLIQNLLFPEDEGDAAQTGRLVETRLMMHGSKGWKAVPYLWNEDGTDADRSVIGEKTAMTLTLASGEPSTFTYITPNMNECKRCHVDEQGMHPIGVTAANLNREIDIDGTAVNQLAHWQDLGLLTGLPEDRESIPQIPDWTDEESASVERRARSWLDVNCSHCHNPRGAASTSGLDLTFQQSTPVRYGVYKPPVAAGRGSAGLLFSILPKKPDESFLVRRMESSEMGVMMPPLGRSTHDAHGVEVIRQWIAEMEVDDAVLEVLKNPVKAYSESLTGTGNPERGKEIFYKVQKCATCHRVGNEGGSVGPNLSDIGKREKPDYILESIVDPNKKIVKGYETQVIITLEGRVFTGTVQSEDQDEVVLADAQNQHVIKKDDIDEREASDVSTMPTMANLLTVDDVRDLIAWLSTLQTPPQK